MNRPDSFVFKYYVFDQDLKTLELKYGFSNGLEFTEIYYFDFDFVDYNDKQLNRALEHLLFMAGVSYFKAYTSDLVSVSKGSLSKNEAKFYAKTYEKGLGEFWYVNGLDPNTKIEFKSNVRHKKRLKSGKHEGLLVGIGGGKDSLVVAEALKEQGVDFMTWSLNHRQQLEPLVNRLETRHAYVDRTIDPKLLELNKTGVFNGHIPISAIIACVGVVVAILTGRRDVVVANEQTASEPNLHIQGVDINHQYSKSLEFEKDFQKLLKVSYGNTLRYYSFIRPLSELFVAEIFSKLGFDKYSGAFSSCNRAYTLNSRHMYWCGACPKCAFVFMILTPFIDQGKLRDLWKGKLLLLEPDLEQTYRQLLGIEGTKPMDCVGEIKEARSAMRMCSKIYPELASKYKFDLPEDYDYRKVSDSSMPKDIQKIFNNFISKYTKI